MRVGPLTRRQFLSASGLLGAGAAAAACSPRAATPEMARTSAPGETPRRLLRIAHLTDMHVFAGEAATQGFARALRHAQGQGDKPDLILNTGDCIMDGLKTSREDAEAQWQSFNRIVEAEAKLPIYHVIGNHDVWGWGLGTGAPKDHPLYGKAMALKYLGLSRRYYSFDRAGWHFIVLDSTHEPNPASEHPYIGKLDEEQYDWLVTDVDAVPAATPICLVSHIPILSACEMLDGPNEASGNWVVPAAWVHIDARRLIGLIQAHPNIRLCLSGHAHQYENLSYVGALLATDGAVCGNWWNGPYMSFPPAYVNVDLFDDGTAQTEFVAYDQA